MWRAGIDAGYRDDGAPGPLPAHEDATVRAFHAAALEGGYEDHGAPGERAVYQPGYYGAVVLDADGRDIEVVNHNRR